MQPHNPQAGGQPVDIGGHPCLTCGPAPWSKCMTRTGVCERAGVVHGTSPVRPLVVLSPSTGHSRRDLRERPFSTGSTGAMTNPEESIPLRHPPTVPRSLPSEPRPGLERTLVHHPATTPWHPADQVTRPVHAHPRTRVLSCPASASMHTVRPRPPTAGAPSAGEVAPGPPRSFPAVRHREPRGPTARGTSVGTDAAAAVTGYGREAGSA